MLKYLTGDIWGSKADAIVIPVNTVGVMGAGLALEVKKRYPQVFKEYKDDCKRGLLQVGHIRTYIPSNEEYCLLFFPTKKDWLKPSKLEYIEEGLKDLVLTIRLLKWTGIQSIALPQLGCGCGGLKWEDVKPLMEKYLKDDVDLKNVEIKIYVKGGNNDGNGPN